MSSSLQEQLLKAGLVTQDQVKQSQHDKRRSHKAQPKARKAERQSARGPSERDIAMRKEQERQRERDLQLNLEREQSKARKEAKQRARQHARKVCVNLPDAEIAFHFVRDGAVKRLYVSEEQREALTAGKLMIVSPAETHFIVPRAEGEAILGMFPQCYVFRADGAEAGDAKSATGASEESDPYAQYQVPDDLVW